MENVISNMVRTELFLFKNTRVDLYALYTSYQSQRTSEMQQMI